MNSNESGSINRKNLDDFYKEISFLSGDQIAGHFVKDYEITGVIGEGGMGRVLSAVHPKIGKKVAIKILKPEFSANKISIQRFFDEARAVNNIRHPNIVDIFDFDNFTDGTLFFIMEHLEGKTLTTLINEMGQCDYKTIYQVIIPIMDALIAAHEKNIVHRDLKPDNIIVNRINDNQIFPKLLDFGIAKITEDSYRSQQTKSGVPIGTPIYMSPEQCSGTDMDERSDIYSLGIILYQMVTGTVPFRGGSFMSIIAAQLTQQPKPPRKFVSIPGKLDRLIMWCLSKEKEDRPPDMLTLKNTLEEILSKAMKSEKNTPIKKGVTIPEIEEFSFSNFTNTMARQIKTARFHKFAFYSITFILFIGAGLVYFLLGARLMNSNLYQLGDISPRGDIFGHTVIRHVEKIKVNPKNNSVIIQLQVEPSDSKYKIFVDGKPEDKSMIKIPRHDTKGLEFRVIAKGFAVWKREIIPAFSQNIPVLLKPLSSGVAIMNSPKEVDIPDVL